MMIKEYKILPIAESIDNPLHMWEIQLTLEPTWLERVLMAKVFSETKILTGSCTIWRWGDGTLAGYFWRLWAHNAIRRHNKSGGTTYVNSRFNRPKDE